MRRNGLEPYLHQEVTCQARIIKFGKNAGTDENIALLGNVFLNGVYIAHHVWLRKNTSETLFQSFQPGAHIVFRAKVHRYQHLNAPPDTWEYGLKNARDFQPLKKLKRKA